MPGTFNSLGILARLATFKNIHIIASLDNINSGLCFNTTLLSCLKFVNFDCTNAHSRYSLEIRCRGFTGETNNSEILLSAIVNIYKSLTGNAQKIGKEVLNIKLLVRISIGIG